MLGVEGLTKSYTSPSRRVAVLRGVEFAVAAGEAVALVGESGCGKTTLLQIIAGLDKPDDGKVWLNTQEITALDDHAAADLRRTALGLVFQHYNLIASLTVADNVAFQARLSGREDTAWTASLMRALGLDGLEGRYPEQLSGGQQQRVAIGRTLAYRPSLILADEPTGNLDEDTSDAVLDLCLSLVRQTGCAFVMVTHAPRLAGRLDRRLRLSAGQVHSDAD